MKTTLSLKLALSGLLLSGLITTAVAETTQDTYLGKIEYQDQTLSKASAEKLNREIELAAFHLDRGSLPLVVATGSYRSSGDIVRIAGVWNQKNRITFLTKHV